VEDFLISLGISVKLAVAGFAGGVVHAFVFVRTSPMAVAGSVVVGIFTSNYLAAPASRLIGVDPLPAAFIVGLGGMAICQGLVAAAQSWRPNSGGQNGPGT